MKTPTALAIDAEVEQVAAIRAARALGIRVVVATPDPTKPAVAEADESVIVDLSNENALIDVARVHGVDLLLPTSFGRYVGSAAAVVTALGLRGPSAEVARLCHDKAEFNRLLERLSLPAPRQRVAVDVDELVAAVRDIGAPCILKPRDGAGSRAVRVIVDADDVPASIAWHLAERDQAGFTQTVVEQLVPGVEYGMNLVVRGGVPIFYEAHRKEMTPLPYRQELSLLVEPEMNPALLARLRTTMETVVEALPVVDCVLSADVIVSPAGDPFIVDFTPRIGGLRSSSTLLPATYGIDLIHESLLLHLGAAPTFAPTLRRAGVLRFSPTPSGRVAHDPDIAAALAMPGVIHVECRARAGDYLPPITRVENVRSRALVVTVADTSVQAEAYWQQAVGALNLAVVPELVPV